MAPVCACMAHETSWCMAFTHPFKLLEVCPEDGTVRMGLECDTFRAFAAVP